MDSKGEEITENAPTEILLPNSPIFSSSFRLTIMLLLFFHKKVRFVELQDLLRSTPGNLDYHLKILATEDYVVMKKSFFLTRPITMIKITEKGKNALKTYAYTLRDILNKIP